jgi:hypothetical protein
VLTLEVIAAMIVFWPYWLDTSFWITKAGWFLDFVA